MKRNWSKDELVEHFTLLPIERQSLGIKDQHNRLGKAYRFSERRPTLSKTHVI